MALTPEEFNKLATKDDLKDLEARVATKEELNEKFDVVLTVLDGITQKLDKIEQELTSNIAAHDRTDGNIEDHESRIKKLELAVG